MTKISNRKEALAIKDKVCEVKEEYLKGDKCFDEFAKLEELTFEDDFCQYLISKYAKLSRFYLDDSEEYSKEYAGGPVRSRRLSRLTMARSAHKCVMSMALRVSFQEIPGAEHTSSIMAMSEPMTCWITLSQFF